MGCPVTPVKYHKSKMPQKSRQFRLKWLKNLRILFVILHDLSVSIYKLYLYIYIYFFERGRAGHIST